jgi:cytochrome oxidase Cu insertion factor (SCO1/SenC/PrrC family)/thiol-disulfide isomerase/thioredoxin
MILGFRLRRTMLLLAVLAAFLAAASVALADGDPGSDVLVYQPLFVAADAGVSVSEQVALGGTLHAAAKAGFPIRVAVIAERSDLGAVTALWRDPRGYARFLGLELSLTYKQRLLVVMPTGFGFYWSGHPTTAAADGRLGRIAIGAGGDGLASAAQSAVRQLAAASGINLAAGGQPAAAPVARAPATSATGSTSGHAADAMTTTIVAGVLAVGLLAFALSRRRRRSPGPGRARGLTVRGVALAGVTALMVIVASAVVVANHFASSSDAKALATNPELDPGTPLSRAAPGFTLSDQFGRPASMSSYRGKVVLLAFNDSECTTICPLTTTAMLDAKRMLGRGGANVQLLGIDANPKATSIEDVLSYSQLHGMVDNWRFLTGSLPALTRVWRAYGIQADIERGLIAHTPALFVIDPAGRLRRLYVTQQSYAAVGQLGQLLAHEASSLLPGHPAVKSDLSYQPISGISPRAAVRLPRAGGGTVALGPSRSPHLYLFFATWDQEVSSLAGNLEALNGYRATATRSGLPPLTAVDEGSVEPSASALPAFLKTLKWPLDYPVAIDRSGRVADGYEVQGQPWFVLTSASGQIVWYDRAYTHAWLSRAALVKQVRAALTHAPKPAAPAGAARELAGSPAPLAALHHQADQLLGSESALAARVKALRGYPIVINAWASWCDPCRAEFGLFASASARYGRSVAFLGANTDDSPGDAQQFLRQHPVSYPSYTGTSGQVGSLTTGGLEGLPSTIFIDRAGKVVNVHAGQYDSQGTLDSDIRSDVTGP